MKSRDFAHFFEKKFPLSLAYDWDNVGLFFAHHSHSVGSVLVALDLTTSVIKQAILEKVDLIIVHHPFLFFETIEEDFAQAPYKKNIYQKLQENNIALYVVHTNYDNAWHGMSYALLDHLELLPYAKRLAEPGSWIVTKKITPRLLKKLIRNKFSLLEHPFYQSNFKKTYHKLVFLPGAGGAESIVQAAQVGADIIITSDVKWSTFLTVKELGIDLLQVSHQIEIVFVQKIKSDLQNAFPKVKVFISLK